LGDIEFGDIDQSQYHNPYERERKKSRVTLSLTNVTNIINSMSLKCYQKKSSVRGNK